MWIFPCNQLQVGIETEIEIVSKMILLFVVKFSSSTRLKISGPWKRICEFLFRHILIWIPIFSSQENEPQISDPNPASSETDNETQTTSQILNLVRRQHRQVSAKLRGEIIKDIRRKRQIEDGQF